MDGSIFGCFWWIKYLVWWMLLNWFRDLVLEVVSCCVYCVFEGGFLGVE